MKNLKEYFESTKGSGVLASADSSGKVDAAIYSRPHFVEEGSLAFSEAIKVDGVSLEKENGNGRQDQDRRQRLPSRAAGPV
jgi:hypothetical protein